MPSSQSRTVDIPQELKNSLRKFRFARRNSGHAAIVIKINKKDLIMEEVEQFDDISVEDLAEGASLHSPTALCRSKSSHHFARAS